MGAIVAVHVRDACHRGAEPVRVGPRSARGLCTVGQCRIPILESSSAGQRRVRGCAVELRTARHALKLRNLFSALIFLHIKRLIKPYGIETVLRIRICLSNRTHVAEGPSRRKHKEAVRESHANFGTAVRVPTG